MLEINLKNKAISQHTRNFNSMCKFGDAYLGASSSGLFQLGGYNDAGTEIPTLVKTGKFDLGTERLKSIRYFYFGLEATGELTITIYADGAEVHTATVQHFTDDRQTVKVKIPRGIKARYWEFKVENVDGCFFALYSVKILPVVLKSS